MVEDRIEREVVAGPLFLAINDEPTGFDNNSGSIAVKVMRRI